MTNNKLISVIIPCYNHEQFIYKTVMSVLEQTYGNIEVLVADDCSTDNSAAILREICDPRLKTFFFDTNHGTVYTVNYLLRKATGDYIATLGSDDFFAPDKLEKQLKVMEDNPALGAVFSWAEIIDENENPYASGNALSVNVFQEKNRTQGEWIRYFFHDGNHLCHSSAMLRREVQESIGLYHASYRQLHDFDCWLRLLCKYPIYVIPEKLTFYRRQNEHSSVSASSSAKNTIRLYNEFNAVFLNLFKRMDKVLFVEAFSDLLSGQEIADEHSLAVEKYKVLRNLSFGGCKLRNASQDFFLDCVDAVDFFDAPSLESCELVNTYYADSAGFAVEYPVGPDVLVELMPSVADHHRHVVNVLTAEKTALRVEIDAMTADRDALEVRRAKLETERKSLEVENNALVEEVSGLSARCQSLDATLYSVYNSTSWKVTKPLRAISMLLKNLLRRG